MKFDLKKYYLSIIANIYNMSKINRFLNPLMQLMLKPNCLFFLSALDEGCSHSWQKKFIA